jgi:hypothetical protein
MEGSEAGRKKRVVRSGPRAPCAALGPAPFSDRRRCSGGKLLAPVALEDVSLLVVVGAWPASSASACGVSLLRPVA